MNMKHSLFCLFILYEFDLGHNTTEAIKDICCANGESTVDHGTVTRWFKKFSLACKNFNYQTRSGRPKTMDSVVMHQADKSSE